MRLQRLQQTPLGYPRTWVSSLFSFRHCHGPRSADRLTAQIYRDFLRTVLPRLPEDVVFSSCEAEIIVSALQSSSAQWRCQAVVERDILRKVDRMSRAFCMASYVARCNSDWYFLVRTSEEVRLCSLSQSSGASQQIILPQTPRS
jgi:hypothetical protein